MKKIFNLKSNLLAGVILGFAFCVYTTLMWLTKLDSTYLSFGQYLDMLIILLPISVIFYTIKTATKKNKILVIQRISIAVFISFISFIIYNPFLYIYHHFINPEWFDAVLNLKELELKVINTPINEIKLELSRMKNSSIAKADLFQFSSIIASVVIIPMLIALLSLIFIKNEK